MMELGEYTLWDAIAFSTRFHRTYATGTINGGSRPRRGSNN
ncbi:hypothetical protein [Moorena sp. SIOASIH]|nr:hypothetical protein [Moorena sp. SIOASIH]